MRKIFLIFILFIGEETRADEDVLTLREAYQQVLVQSESLAIQNETIKVAEAHYLQALGEVLPRLDVNASEFIQDTSGTSSSSSSVTSTFTKRSRPEVAFTMTQPLFQGFREFQAVKIAHVEKRKNRLATERAKQLLLADVARAYYIVLELEAEMRIHKSILSTLTKRWTELKERVDLGKSRESEFLSTESEVAFIKAEQEKLKGQIEAGRDMLGFLVGKKITKKLIDEFSLPQSIPSLETYQTMLVNRADLKAAGEETKLAKGQLNYNRGELFPDLDVTGNYYPYRTGYQEDIKWDVNFTMSVPLFSATSYGNIREASAELRQTKLNEQEKNRKAILELTQAHHHFAASQAALTAFKIAEKKSGAHYTSLEKEYGLNVVHHLDVLQGLREWQERRIQFNLAFFQTKLYYLDLLMAVGEELPL